MSRLVQGWKHFVELYQKEIWRASHLKDRSLRGRLYASLRIISITLTGLIETKMASRAAALSFSSLLGLGPLVAIAVLVAGFVLDQRDPDLAVNTLNKIIKFVAPQIAQYESMKNEGQAPPSPENRSDVVTAATLNLPSASSTQTPEDPDNAVPVNPELVQLIDGFISGSRSGAAGVIGVLTLIIIVLQLFTSVENAFNEIWGVRRGRSWLMRIVFYWTILTLGAVLFFTALTGLSASAFFNAFAEKLPFGNTVMAALRVFLPSLSIVALILILTVFYRYIPNTHVFWKAAFIGALVVATLIVINNFLAFLYFRRVILSKSLYGSLGILPILMFGLYIFWLFVLLGGQVSYAVQNVHYRNSQAAWGHLAESTRAQISLIVLITIGRRFQHCLPPSTASQLSSLLKVPTQILNECLRRLVGMQLLTPVPPLPGGAASDFLYQPARPLSRITLAEFKTLQDNFSEDGAASGPVLVHLDPLMQRYLAALDELQAQPFFQKTLEELIAEEDTAPTVRDVPATS